MLITFLSYVTGVRKSQK